MMNKPGGERWIGYADGAGNRGGRCAAHVVGVPKFPTIPAHGLIFATRVVSSGGKQEMSKRRGTWDQLQIMPGHLTKMLTEGKAKTVGKDKFGRRIWEIEE